MYTMALVKCNPGTMGGDGDCQRRPVVYSEILVCQSDVALDMLEKIQ
ncbi:MAG: hypothetical protein RL367_1585 [Pseudomonadota bacterium]